MSRRNPFRGRSRRCRGCGCSEHISCVVDVTPSGPIGCTWVLLDVDAPSGICSACAIELGWDQDELINIGCDMSAPHMPLAERPPRLVLP